MGLRILGWVCLFRIFGICSCVFCVFGSPRIGFGLLRCRIVGIASRVLSCQLSPPALAGVVIVRCQEHGVEVSEPVPDKSRENQFGTSKASKIILYVVPFFFGVDAFCGSKFTGLIPHWGIGGFAVKGGGVFRKHRCPKNFAFSWEVGGCFLVLVFLGLLGVFGFWGFLCLGGSLGLCRGGLLFGIRR